MEDDDEIDAMLSQVLRKRKPLRARDDFCRHLIPAFAVRLSAWINDRDVLLRKRA